MAFLAGWSFGVVISVSCALVIWGAAIARRHLHDRTNAREGAGKDIRSVTSLKTSGD
jgi:hypothetical protein